MCVLMDNRNAFHNVCTVETMGLLLMWSNKIVYVSVIPEEYVSLYFPLTDNFRKSQPTFRKIER